MKRGGPATTGIGNARHVVAYSGRSQDETDFEGLGLRLPPRWDDF
jgi:hypothetical protein